MNGAPYSRNALSDDFAKLSGKAGDLSGRGLTASAPHLVHAAAVQGRMLVRFSLMDVAVEQGNADGVQGLPHISAERGPRLESVHHKPGLQLVYASGLSDVVDFANQFCDRCRLPDV